MTAGAQDNSLARIVRIVEDAQERKGACQRIAQQLAKPLVRGVMVAAAAIGDLGSLFGSPDIGDLAL